MTIPSYNASATHHFGGGRVVGDDKINKNSKQINPEAKGVKTISKTVVKFMKFMDKYFKTSFTNKIAAKVTIKKEYGSEDNKTVYISSKHWGVIGEGFYLKQEAEKNPIQNK